MVSLRGVICIIIAAGLFLWETVSVILSRKTIEHCEIKVRLKNRPSNYIIWIFISLLNMILQFFNYSSAIARDNTEDAEDFITFGIICLLFTFYYVFAMIFIRNTYLTSDGLLYSDSWKICPKEDYQYIIDDDILELYYKDIIKPLKFRITENQDEIAEILTENYKPYEKEAEN